MDHDHYIDIHSHILPGLDDGSADFNQTMSIVKLAIDENIGKIIATPHYHEGIFVNNMQNIYAKLDLVREAVDKEGYSMDFAIGCEVYYSHEIVRLLHDRVLPTLADSRYVLVEFSPLDEFRYIKNGLLQLICDGYLPILAHTERYRNVIRDMDSVSELIETGSYIQVNSRSLTGGAGGRYRRIAKRLLKKNYIHFIATDTHNEDTRGPTLKEAANFITKRYGEGLVRKLLIENPTKILSNQYIKG